MDLGYETFRDRTLALLPSYDIHHLIERLQAFTPEGEGPNNATQPSEAPPIQEVLREMVAQEPP